MMDKMMKKQGNGFFVTKSFAIIVLVIFGAVLLTVSLMIGLLTRGKTVEKYIYVTDTTPARPTVTTETTTDQKTTTDPYGPGPWENIRLPAGLKTYHYTLTFKDIDNTKATYSGTTEAEFNLSENQPYLLFHIKFLTVNSVKLMKNGEEIDIPDKFEYKKNQFYVLKPVRALSPGNYSMIVQYTGLLNQGIVGMYQSSYEENGVKKYMVSTKFEPTDARKAFACFDEPSLKATYTVIIEHAANTIALSNFPVKDTRPGSRATTITTEFEKTFAMSTYLIAWVIAPDDFDYAQGFTSDNKTVRIYARKFAVDKGLVDYALEATIKALDFFQDVYFNISEAVPPKIDMIAIPEFPSGAMEHWGLVGFRETRLLFSETENSAATKQQVTSTITHEIAHFWFGNLVTCAWWNDLWLNEAMASFLQIKAMGVLYPEMNIVEQAITDDYIPVMWDDGYESSHPVEVDVQNPDQINNIFDSITYSKGASLLMMLENVVGEDVFRDGLRNYLRNNAFQPGVAAQFYSTLELPAIMNSSTTPTKFMENWLQQMNYPLVGISLSRSGGNTIVSFNQTRFLIAGPTVPPTQTYEWQIYLKCVAGGTYDPSAGDAQHTTGNVVPFEFYFDSNKGTLELTNRQYTWVKCNKDFKGYYITNYDDEIFKAFTKALESKPDWFSQGDRSNMIHVSYQLAYLGTKSYSIPALLNKHMSEKESSFVPWRVFVLHINRFLSLLETKPTFEKLSQFVIKLTETFLKGMDIWDGTGNHVEKRMKAMMIDFLCRIQQKECLVNSTQKYELIPAKYFTDPDNTQNPLSPNIRLTVYRYNLQNTFDYQDWLNLFQVYVKTVDPQEQANVLSALSYTRSTWILNKYLDIIMRPNSQVRLQDFFTVLNAVSRNPSGRYIAWYFMREKWDDLVDKFKITDRTFGRSVKAVCDLFDTQFLYNEMIAFFQSKPNAGAGESPREQAKDIVKSNIQWLGSRENDLSTNLFKL